MLQVFREMVISLRSMDIEITDDQANQSWKEFGPELSNEILGTTSDLMIERQKTWANPPILSECLQEAIKINKEGSDGINTTGTEAEESRVQNGAVDRENGPVNDGGGEPPKGIGDSSISKRHDQSAGPCCRSGLIFARRKETDGRLSQSYVFRCSCFLGARYVASYSTWHDEQDYIRED